MKQRFNQIVGIDQTGALDSRRRFRPLYSVKLKLSADGAILAHSADYLKVLDLNQWRQDSFRTLILVDAVLGIPEPLLLPNESIRDLFQLTRNLTEFGMKGGENFFSKLYLKRSGRKLSSQVNDHELRDCERIAHAQSVFRAKPYQRNVQTGTLRVWHELSQQNLDDIVIWPFDPILKKSQIVLAEGYPRIFQDISLPKLPELDNPNFRDAARLAFGARECMLQENFFLAAQISREGGIFSIHPKKRKKDRGTSA